MSQVIDARVDEDRTFTLQGQDNLTSVTGDTRREIRGQNDEREAVLDAEARDEGLFTTAGRAFRAGDNIAYSVYRDLDRMWESGPVDPAWAGGNLEAWLNENSDVIPANQQWRYLRTGNEQEAKLLLRDQQSMENERRKIERIGGVQALVAGGIAGLMDIDAPLTLFTGGLSASAKLGINATKAGRLMTGAASGAMIGGTLGAVDYQANPLADWTTIPVMGLAGMAFGTLGGAISRGPNLNSTMQENVQKSMNEFGEYINDGMPLQTRDINAPVTPPVSTVRQNDALGVEGDRRIASQEVADAIDAEVARQARTEAGTTSAGNVPGEASDPARQARAIDTSAVIEGQDAINDPYFTEQGSLSAGAAQLRPTGPGIGSIDNARLRQHILDAEADNRANNVSIDWYAKQMAVDNAMTRAATRFHDAIQATGIVSDFGRFMRSGSAVAQNLAFHLLEDPSGIIRNNRSAASLMEHYHKMLQGRFVPYQDAFVDWSKARNKTMWDRTVDSSIRREFDRDVIFELNARAYDAPNTVRNVDPHIKAAADAWDNAFAMDIQLGKGRPGELSVKGYENLKERSGYMPQRANSARANRMIHKYGKKNVIDLMAAAYRSQHPMMTAKEAAIYAEAWVDRVIRNADDTSSNMITILRDSDSRRAVEDLFKRNGFSQQDIDQLIDRITGNRNQAGMPSHTKQRIDIDMRFEMNGMKVFDLFETDLNKLGAARLRRGAGQAALARKGITSRQDWDEKVDAALAEQNARGASAKTPNPTVKERLDDYIDSDKPLTREDFDALHTLFNGRPVGGGISPAYSRLIKITRLATLNGLGLTQMAETATTIASMGMQRYLNALSKELKDSLRNVDSPLVQELKHMNIFVPEERLFRDDLVHEFEKDLVTNEYLKGIDNMLNKAQRLQGYTSGFYEVRKLQQRIAVTAGADKIARFLKTGNGLSADRLRDAGMSAKDINTFRQQINAFSEFDNEGNLVRLNLQDWSSTSAEDFALVLNRVVNQDVQKAMAGEGAAIFHRDGLAALFWQLKAFPMLALEKQAYRNMRMMDQQAAATFLYGLATAGTVYSVRQLINGRPENLEAGKIARGAFGMSNITGWIPMWVDPLAGMLGMDDYNLSGYGRFGGPSVLSTPVSFSVADRLLRLPGTALSALDGELSNSEITTLQALPIIGNAYGFSLMFNMMKD